MKYNVYIKYIPTLSEKTKEVQSVVENIRDMYFFINEVARKGRIISMQYDDNIQTTLF